jgi:hypothetical protein
MMAMFVFNRHKFSIGSYEENPSRAALAVKKKLDLLEFSD